MGGETSDVEPYNLAELLSASDLSARDRRSVYDAIVSSAIEGDLSSVESVLRLIEFAAGRIDMAEYKRQVLNSLAE